MWGLVFFIHGHVHTRSYPCGTWIKWIKWIVTLDFLCKWIVNRIITIDEMGVVTLDFCQEANRSLLGWARGYRPQWAQVKKMIFLIHGSQLVFVTKWLDLCVPLNGIWHDYDCWSVTNSFWGSSKYPEFFGGLGLLHMDINMKTSLFWDSGWAILLA